jgi:hypothetical protein
MDIFDLIDPAELTGYARTAQADRPENQFQLSEDLPDDTVDDLVYRMSKGGGGLTQAASFRTYDAEPGFGRRKGVKRVTGELPPIARQMLLDEYTQLRTRGANNAAIEDALLRDSVSLVREIDARMELARGQALVEARVVLSEDGVEAVVDFDRNPAHSPDAETAWSDPDADILADVDNWMEQYVATNGGLPGRIRTTTKVVQAMKRNRGLLRLKYPTVADAALSGMRLQLRDIQELFADEGWPAPTVYDAKVINPEGQVQRILAEGAFLMLPTPGTGLDGSSGLGKTLYGTTLEAQEPEYGIEDAEQPGIVVAAFKQKTTPVQVVTIASGIGIPILGDADLSFSGDTGVR